MANTSESTLESVSVVMVDDLFELMTATAVMAALRSLGAVTEDQLMAEMEKLAIIFLAKYGAVPTGRMQ